MYINIYESHNNYSVRKKADIEYVTDDSIYKVEKNLYWPKAELWLPSLAMGVSGTWRGN